MYKQYGAYLWPIKSLESSRTTFRINPAPDTTITHLELSFMEKKTVL